MNDRFKFRIWNPDLQSYDDNRDYNVAILVNQDFGLVLKPYRDNIIEMCTGLKDKNGKLIYEGDIVRFEIVDEESVLGKTFERICEICFGKGDYSYSFVCKNDAYYRGYALLSSILCQEIESIEIIGNIHEQAEQKDVK